MSTSNSHAGPYLAPVQRPTGLMVRMGYAYSKRQFGKVFSPLSVFNARMPTAFLRFYGKVGSLAKKLTIPSETVLLLRGAVAATNGCGFCIDANRVAAEKISTETLGKVDALPEYATSPAFDAKQRSALSYAIELTRDRSVSPQTFAALAEHHSEREICEVVWVVASEHLYNLNNIGLGIGSDGLCTVAR